MKYIEKKYQDLIEDIKSTYEEVLDTLKDRIDGMRHQLAEKDEEIEKLKNIQPLAEKAQHNTNLEEELASAQAKKPSSKKGSFLITCQVCGKSFFAKSKSAKYCKACRKEKNREYQRKWQAKRSK